MRRIALLLAMTVFTAARIFPQTPSYDLDLALDPEHGLVRGSVTVRLPPGDRRQTLYIRLLLNTGETPDPKLFPYYEQGRGPDGFSVARATVADVTVNGRSASVSYVAAPLYETTYSLERVFASIDLSGVDAASPAVVSFTYEAKLPHVKGSDEFFFDDKMISRYGWFPYVTAESQLGELLFTSFTYTARLSLPEGWEMARVGTSFEREGGIVRVASSSPVVSFPLVLLKGYTTYSVGWLQDGRTLDVLYRPTAEDAARLVSGYAREALEYYARRYFPYEGRYVSVVQGNPGSYGMAADSLVILGDGLFGGLNRGAPGILTWSLEYVIDHEIGHFYWGVGTPPDFLSENWLSEGINEYSTLTWYEEKHGRWDNLFSPQSDLLAREYVDYAATVVGHSYASEKLLSVHDIRTLGWDEPLSGPRTEKISNAQSSVDYDKAWFVLSMLARYVGRDELQRALGDYARQRRYAPFSARQLESFLSEETGRDLGPFFDAFVFGTKSLDYELTGALNEREQAGYRSTFTVRDRSDSGIFVPTTLTAFLDDGTTKEVAVEAPGDYVVRTAVPVSYAGVDKDAENLDLDRKNNFWPRRILLASGTDYWLLDGATDRIYPSALPYVASDEDAGTLSVGTGLTLGDELSYAVTASGFAALPLTAEASYGVGAALSASFTPSVDASLTLSAAYLAPATLSSVGLSFSKSFYLPVDTGLSARFFYPTLSLDGSAAVRGIDLAESGAGYFSASADVVLDTLPTTGTVVTVSDSLRWRWREDAVEDRVSLDATQAIPFLAATLLGVELRASAGFGELSVLGGSNEALGIDSTGDAVYPYDASALAFLGLPLCNDIDLSVGNWIVLQSLNLAVVYQAGAAFTSGADAFSRVQQAVGIELLPMIRTVGDTALGLAIGVGFDLNAIAAAPDSTDSYVPAVFVDLSTLPELFNSVTPY